MFQTFKNAWAVLELRKKMLFTLLILLLYRIGANLFIPYVDVNVIGQFSEMYSSSSGMFGMLSMMSGEAFGNATFFALSVSPYITASIVMQLLSIAIPALEKMSKDEEGKKKIATATRWVTAALALVTAFGYVNILNRGAYVGLSSTGEAQYQSVLTSQAQVVEGEYGHIFPWIVMIAALVGGACLIMWLAEKINDHGIGNGISMILFANILSGFTGYVTRMVGWIFAELTPYIVWQEGADLIKGIVMFIVSAVYVVGAVVLIVWFTNSERRIKVIYAKKVVGRKMYGGQKTNLPLKMNMAGVMPVIFASSIASLPQTLMIIPGLKESWFGTFVNDWWYYEQVVTNAAGQPETVSGPQPMYIIVFIALLFAFSYFYIAISFNPVEVANNIRNNGGAIIGIRPQEMAPFIKKILNRVTLMGAVFLTIISGIPLILACVMVLSPAFRELGFTSIAMTGTSLLIVVGVALETVRDLEAQLTMRNYKGFLD